MSNDSVKVSVEIRNNITKEIKVVESNTAWLDEDGTICCFWWEDGNGACDCNRGLLFGDKDIVCGNELYNIKITNPETNDILYNEFDEEQS